MKVLISVGVWGQRYAETFVNYSIASQLSPNNIPGLVRSHKLTYHVVTTRRDANWMSAHPMFQKLLAYCDIVWDLFEDLNFNVKQIPVGLDGEKYSFLSRLQNLGFERSLEHDVLIFNYADFVWPDGALLHILELLGEEIDAVLGFCPPVDSKAGRIALDAARPRGESGVLKLLPRAAADIIGDHLHAEAKLRIWEAPEFSSLPTYLIWTVGSEGLLVRAYHQTVLALRVKADDAFYRGGIQRGSLDGYFTAMLAERGGIAFATDSDRGLAFSLYETSLRSELPAGQSREDAIKQCLRVFISEGQRRFAEVPLLFKRRFTDAVLWDSVIRQSWRILSKLHEEASPNWSAFVKTQAPSGELAELEQRWRAKSSWRVLFYRHVLAGWIVGPVGRVTKGVLGPRLTRNLRAKIESWIFRYRA